MTHKIFAVLLFVWVGLPAFSYAGSYTFKGKISNTNHEALPGVNVYFPELKTGGVTGSDGCFTVSGLPDHKLLLQISSVGYKMIVAEINPAKTSQQNFQLEESVTEIAEVAITGQANSTRLDKLPAPVAVVTSADLQRAGSTNVIDALSKQPGISQITTGGGISKPVIRGLGYNRVVVMTDGVKQEGQQWGDEHGIEVDEYDINRVEILKGPASLMYGSDAMAGVINLFQSPILPQGKMSLNLLANYQTNNGLRAYSLNFGGHKSRFVWNLRYSTKQAHAYQNRYDGYVFNSGFQEHALSALAGINSWWGYSHLTFSTYHLKPGIVEGDRGEETGKFVKETTDGEEPVSDAELKSYDLQVPYQRVDHNKLVWNNHLLVGDGSLRFTVAYQQNRRREYAEVEDPDQYGLYFNLQTVSYALNYRFPETAGYTLSTGINGMYQKSSNRGTEFLVPAYHLFDAGMFVVASKSVGAFDLSAGMRYDSRSQQTSALYVNQNGNATAADDANAMLRFTANINHYRGVSGSVGFSYHPSEQWTHKVNLAKGFRAPNISETGSNGVHEGTLRYETGNNELKPEFSTQLDYELAYTNKHITARLNLFANRIQHYIYLRKLASVHGGDSIKDEVPVYQFHSGNAMLAGTEFYLDFHPHPWDWMHIENSFSYVHSQLLQQPDSMRYLPFTPPAKWVSDIRFDIRTPVRALKKTFLTVGFEKYFAQNLVYSAYGTETATPGYMLWNLAIGTDIQLGKNNSCTLLLNGTNLTDEAYQSHLSRLKYGPVNQLTGRSGVYNMGRNISLKLIVPVDF